MRPDIIPRAIFPDYELSEHAAKHRKLSELQGPHPMVLVLSRGGFCPKDRYAEGLRQRKRLSNSQQPHHVGGPKMAHAGCWAHARRKFFRAVELNPKDQSAIGIVAQIDELFKVDRRAREQGLTPDARHAFRLVNSQPLLEEIRSRIEAARAAALPKSLLAKAANYTLSLWPRLNLFLQYPELELSNNWAENAIRPLALGRKNWIHIGSEEAGPRVAAIVSIIETCRRLSIPVRDYPGSILPGLANFPAGRIAEVTPSAWAARNQLTNRD